MGLSFRRMRWTGLMIMIALGMAFWGVGERGVHGWASCIWGKRESGKIYGMRRIEYLDGRSSQHGALPMGFPGEFLLMKRAWPFLLPCAFEGNMMRDLGGSDERDRKGLADATKHTVGNTRQ